MVDNHTALGGFAPDVGDNWDPDFVLAFLLSVTKDVGTGNYVLGPPFHKSTESVFLNLFL
jgi:hypothetical protein